MWRKPASRAVGMVRSMSSRDMPKVPKPIDGISAPLAANIFMGGTPVGEDGRPSSACAPGPGSKAALGDEGVADLVDPGLADLQGFSRGVDGIVAEHEIVRVGRGR